MRFCTGCGSELVPGAKFCRDCGTPVPTAGPPPAAPVPVAPPAAPPGQPPTWGPTPTPYAAPRPGFDPWSIVRGNWIAAGATAGVILLALLVGAFGLVMLVNPPHTTFGDKLDVTVMLAAAALGANQFMRIEGSDDEATGEVLIQSNAVPLMLTVLALALGIAVFRRLTRAQPSALVRLGDAARAALLVALPLFVLSLVFRGGIGSFTGDYEVAKEDGLEELTFGASAPGALITGFLVVFLVLGVALLARPEGWGPRLSTIHRVLAAPLAALALLVVALPVLGALGWATAPTTGDLKGDSEQAWEEFKDGDGDVLDIWAAGVATAPNAGFAYLSLGTGGRVGVHGGADGEFEGDGVDLEINDSTGAWTRLGGVINGPEDVASQALDGVDDDTLDTLLEEACDVAGQCLETGDVREAAREADDAWNDEVEDAWPGPWGLWFAIPVALVLLFGLTWFVGRRGRRQGNALVSLGAWVGVLMVTLPLLARWSSGITTVSGELDIDDDFVVDGSAFTGFGVKGSDTLLIALICLGFGLVVAVLTGAIDVRRFSSLQQAPAGAPQPWTSHPSQPPAPPMPPGPPTPPQWSHPPSPPAPPTPPAPPA